jgi:hypothetical protein
MKKTYIPLLWVFILVFHSSPTALAINLSTNAEITLLTASPGDELYSVFGHSAIRVIDPENDIDVVFNYGTFDFDTPNFYLKFVRGKLLYKLSTARMEQFVPEYYLEGRAIFEQVLNLTQEQKQDVFNFLMINRLPENAYYHYDFFYDNCATRIRDLIDGLLDVEWAHDNLLSPDLMGPIRSKLEYEFEFQPEVKPNRTFRDMLNPFLVNMPWSKFGIDIALGLPADKVAHPYNYMYLPDEMLIAFDRARFSDGSSLVSESRVILRKEAPLSPAGFFTPNKVMWILFVISLLSFIHPKFSRFFDIAFFTILGITGLVILFMWFLSDHITTKGNLNILWAIPTHLYYIWVANYRRENSFSVFYFRLIVIISFLLLLLWSFIPQALNPAFFPIILIALIKSLPYGFNLPWVSQNLSSRYNIL